jgi:hypothetical protein
MKGRGTESECRWKSQMEREFLMALKEDGRYGAEATNGVLTLARRKEMMEKW